MLVRKFLPVGQGAFYCEQFVEESIKEKINIIYDCGSLNVKIVENQISKNFEKNETIHAVFISHLDEDHINGLPFLLKYCNVKNIFFPLITSLDAQYIKLNNIIKSGNSNAFSVLFVDNPKAAFEQVENFGEENWPEVYPINANRHNDIDALEIQSGTDVSTIIFNDVSINNKIYHKWEYVPYNFRQEERLKQLVDNLNREISNKDLFDIWKNGTDEQRNFIKDAYRKVKGSLNTNSMTIYSGMKEHMEFYRINAVWFETGKMGALYLGDYNASGKDKWKKLKEAYNIYWNNIGCVQIPHHGSKGNYNDELAKLDAYHIISAGKKNRYHHPHNTVLKSLLFNKKFPYIVTEEDYSEIQFRINI